MIVQRLDRRVAQAALHTLARVEDMRGHLLKLQLIQQVVFLPLRQHPHQLGVGVEVIFNRRFAASGDEQHVLNPVLHQLFGNVLHDGLPRHRQHLLRLRLRRREQSCAVAGNRNNRA